MRGAVQTLLRAAGALARRLDSTTTTVLAAFAVAVGAFSVLGSLTAVDVVASEFSSVLAGLDVDAVMVQQYEIEPAPGSASRPPIRHREVAHLRAARPRLQISAQAVIGPASVRPRARGEEVLATVIAGDDLHTVGFGRPVVAGRAFSPSDLASRTAVALLDIRAADELFGSGRALGERVWVGGRPFRVVGLTEGRAALFGATGPPIVVVPLPTAYAYWGGDAVSHVSVRSGPGGAVRDDLRDEVEGAFRAVRATDARAATDFSVIVNGEVLDQADTLSAALETGAVLLGAIALAVAGFGLGNLMWARVQAETVEIGVRRALGARRVDVAAEYLGEAVAIAWSGAALGAGASAGVGLALSAMLGVDLAFPWDWLLRVLALVSVVAVGFGAGPAMRAAHLSPIQALRTL